MRQFLKLADNPLDSKAAARSAAALASAAQALDWMTDTLAASRIKASVQSVELDANDLPRELQRRLLLKSIRMIDPDYIPRRNFIARLLDDLSAGKKSTIGDIVCTGGSTWKFTPAPQRHNQSRQSSTGRTDGATE